MFAAALGVLALILVAFYAFTTQPLPGPVACTMEAKICPDGTAVGRTGPNCEFAACPSEALCEGGTCPPSTAVATSTATLQLNQAHTVAGTTLTVTKVLEESRCPSDVTCIQAGRVRVALAINSPSGPSQNELELGQTVTTETLAITLTEVTPYPLSTRTISEGEYRFALTIAPHDPSRLTNPPIDANKTGTLQMSVTIGPICPVEREGEPCKPTPEMFAARKVYVYRPNHTTLVTTLTPDATGNITTTLPVGDYWVDMPSQGIGGVTGLPASIRINAGTTTTLTINVDTGIR